MQDTVECLYVGKCRVLPVYAFFRYIILALLSTGICAHAHYSMHEHTLSPLSDNFSMACTDFMIQLFLRSQAEFQNRRGYDIMRTEHVEENQGGCE